MAGPRVTFGPFEFDPVTGELWRDGAPVHLQQQPAKVLALLVSHPGELLTRDQVRQHVWGEGTFVDFQRGLNFAVMQIRTALGDEAESPRYVETLARRGYRFVAPVESNAPVAGDVVPRPPAPAAAGGGPADTRPAPGSGRGRRRVAFGAGVLVLAAVAAAVWWPVRSVPASGRKMIVVVPFRHLGPAEEQFLADGMTDEIACRLASIRDLGVISPTSARQYAGTAKSIRQIGSELGVEYVLEGSVRWERPPSGPARVRVTPRLVRVADEVQVWTRIWERELGEVLRLQSELAREVAGELNVRLAGSEQGQAERSASPEAYEAYLRGRAAQERHDGPGLRLAADLFERSVELDPGFAPAWAQLAHSHALLCYHSPGDARPDRAREAVEKALAIDPGLARARLALGYYHYTCQRDLARALDAAAAAERGLPGDAALLRLLGLIHRRRGRVAKALESQEEAFALSPRDAILAWDLGSTQAMLGRYDDAGRSWETAIALAPDVAINYRTWADLRLRRGDFEGARRILRRAPGPVPPVFAATIEYYAGEHDAGLRLLAEAPPGRSEVDAPPRELLQAFALAAKGDRTRAAAAFAAAHDVLAAELERRPGDAVVLAELGLALAGLGRSADALAAGRRAVAALGPEPDAVDGPSILIDLAATQSLVGEREGALDTLERVAALPYRWLMLSDAYLEAEPLFRPLRDHPRFRRLVEASRGR